MADTQREPGVIRADCAYDLAQVKTRLGLGTAAIRTARRKGLTVRRIGRKSFVLGKDILEYLTEHATIVVLLLFALCLECSLSERALSQVPAQVPAIHSRGNLHQSQKEYRKMIAGQETTSRQESLSYQLFDNSAYESVVSHLEAWLRDTGEDAIVATEADWAQYRQVEYVRDTLSRMRNSFEKKSA